MILFPSSSGSFVRNCAGSCAKRSASIPALRSQASSPSVGCRLVCSKTRGIVAIVYQHSRGIARQRAARLDRLIGPQLDASAPGKILPGDPLRRKADMVRPNVLIGDRFVPGGRRHNDPRPGGAIVDRRQAFQLHYSGSMQKMAALLVFSQNRPDGLQTVRTVCMGRAGKDAHASSFGLPFPGYKRKRICITLCQLMRKYCTASVTGPHRF